MNSTTAIYTVDDYNIFTNKMLNWANRFNIFCFLENNGYNKESAAFDCMLAVGCKRSILLKPGSAFSSLKEFYDSDPSWLFGHLGYDLKNETEILSSRHKDVIDFGIGFFFEPDVLLQLQNKKLSISSEVYDVHQILKDINNEPGEILKKESPEVNVQESISKESYIKSIEAIKHHIHRGDCYEINFCQSFFSNNANINPLYIYRHLVKYSPNPFAAFYKLQDKYCLCASPERYLKKTGHTIISQPIKGTSKRNAGNKVEDEDNKNYLKNSSKEQSENVMVVDLVRNDLSRISKEGTVKVEELFGIYSFPQVHQMISTISGTLADDAHWTDAIKATFPMGSMTGAPKKRVMELIEEYEATSRGLFSGSIGYITPNNDFDFNVVIRSIFYDLSQQYLTFSAGGGITFNSNAEEEYRETMLKASAILKVLKEK